jgi:3-hydroxyisobutyrate dehydrogenase
METNNMTKVTVLGLGIMGSGIAHNILKAGYPLTVYNRTKAKAASLIEAGAQWADSPALAAQNADVVISVVGDDEASRAVWLGAGETAARGAFATLRPQAIGVECSTLSLEWMREWHALAREHGVQSIDAPLSGSKLAAQSATLTLFIGGEAEIVDRARSILATFANNLMQFGPPLSGTIYKLVNNLQGGIQLAALCEGIALAERAGLDREVVLAALISGGIASPIVKGKAERVLDHDYEEVHFALRWMLKDLTYALRAADELGVPVPLVAAAREVYKLAVQAGLGDLDMAAVGEVLQPSAR